MTLSRSFGWFEAQLPHLHQSQCWSPLLCVFDFPIKYNLQFDLMNNVTWLSKRHFLKIYILRKYTKWKNKSTISLNEKTFERRFRCKRPSRRTRVGHNHTVHSIRIFSISWGQWSQVHSNACFISPLILIKGILSRLLGINIERFWHYSHPRGSRLLVQGFLYLFCLLMLPFGCVGNIKTRAIRTCMRYNIG